MNDTDERVEGNTGEREGTTRIHEGNTGERRGNDGGITGKDIVDHIWQTLRENDSAKKEIYRQIKAEIHIDPEPFFEKFLGERQDKKTALKDIEMPLREIAENVLQYTTDGYAPSQIAETLGIFPSQVSRILKEKDHWEKEIANAARKQTIQNKKVPFILRLAARLKLI